MRPYIFYQNLFQMKKILTFISLTILFSCSERDRDNPFDPGGDEPVSLSARSINKSVELSWSNPNLMDHSGFNIYRKQEGSEQFFTRIAALPLFPRNYTDTTISFGNTYVYYVKVASGTLESGPSEAVSVTPGPGFNWIVDETSFQVRKMSYDLSYTFIALDTYPGMPTDMAVSTGLETGVILYNRSSIIQEIDLSGNLRNQYEQIRHPYAVAFDSVGSLFWIVDSSGILYTLDTQANNINYVYVSFSNPISIHIAPEKNLISIVDAGSKEIVQFNRSGNLVNKISSINGKPLQGPYRYVVDEKHDRSWLVDGNSNIDYIYTKSSEDEEFFLADSASNAGDIEVSLSSELAWYVSFNRDSSIVLQLSSEGTRQLELSYFFNPFDLHVNPYDGSLLVVDSWNGKILHYNESNRLIGEMENLIFPVKVVVQ
jgi:hypothetical protein